MPPIGRCAVGGFFIGENMGSLESALETQKTRENGEKLDSFLKRVFKFGRPGKEVLFDAPGVQPTTFRIEPLNGEETEECQLSAYNYVAKKLGDNVKGRIEDTDMYDERLLLELLHAAVKRPETPYESNGIKKYYQAAFVSDEYKKLTNEQRTYLHRQYQLVVAEFSPTQAQLLAMRDIEAFTKKCAEAVSESGDGFLFLASLSWQEAITLVGVLGAHLHPYLVQSQTQSHLADTLASSLGTSTGSTDSSTESQSPTSSLLERSEAVRIVLENSLQYSADSQSEAEELARKLTE